MRNLFLALILLSATTAQAKLTTLTINAGREQILLVRDTSKTNDLNIIEAEATNGSPTVTIPLDRAWAKLRLFTFATYVANTYVTIKVECSLDGTNPAVVQSRSIDSGTATLSDLSDYKALATADQDFMTEYDVRGCMDVKITLGGDNTDVADLQAVVVR